MNRREFCARRAAVIAGALLQNAFRERGGLPRAVLFSDGGAVAFAGATNPVTS